MNKTTQSTSVESKPNKPSIDCKICGALALNSYVGVVTCPSCKIFFRRNAKTKQVRSKYKHMFLFMWILGSFEMFIQR